MSKVVFFRATPRTENRLQNLKVENKDVDVSGPKPRRAGKSPGSDATVQAEEVAPPRSPGQ